MAKRQKPAGKSDPLPEHLRITPERRKKIEEQQARLRELANSRGRLAPEARRIQLAGAHETSARADVEMLTAAVRDDSKNRNLVDRLTHAKSRLADALAQQGRYDEAAEVEPDADKQTHYETLWEAVWRDDEETCPCPSFQDGEMSLTRDHVVEEVISLKHDGRLMPAVRCNQCGCVNVRPLPYELRQLENARSKAAAVVHGRTGRDLKHNAAQLLTGEDLHDRKLLRK